jgi:hypothetical protein
MSDVAKNIEILEKIEFNHVKNASQNIKQALRILQAKPVNTKQLEVAQKQLETALDNMRKFTEVFNKQHSLVINLKLEAGDVEKGL